MKSLMTRNLKAALAISSALALAPVLRAAEPPGDAKEEKPTAAEEKHIVVAEEPEAEVEEEEEQLFTCGFDNDLFTAYVWRNAVIVDELVWQPCVWADFNAFGWFTIGGSVWQNWNLTANPDKFGMPRAMNETDFNLHIARSLWSSDDGEYDLSIEIGNDIYTYRQWEDCPNVYEIYLKLTFDNPFVGVYGQYVHAYEPVAAPYFELGLYKEATLAEIFSSENEYLERCTVGAEWNLSLASGKYLTSYLYGSLPGEYDPETDECDERNMSNGVGGTTIKGTFAYQVCDHFSLGFVLAYTALLSGEACEAMDWAESGNMYKRLVWGGLQAKLDF